jgi:hypothetical protein
MAELQSGSQNEVYQEHRIIISEKQSTKVSRDEVCSENQDFLGENQKTDGGHENFSGRPGVRSRNNICSVGSGASGRLGSGGSSEGGPPVLSNHFVGDFGNEQRQDLETLKYLNEQYHKKYGKNKSVDNNQQEKNSVPENQE